MGSITALLSSNPCCAGLVSVDDVIAKHTKEGDARRALHELYDGMNAYSETLLYHLSW